MGILSAWPTAWPSTMLSAIAMGMSTMVRVSNWREMDANAPVCQYSTAAYAAKATARATAVRIAHDRVASSAEKFHTKAIPAYTTMAKAARAAT